MPRIRLNPTFIEFHGSVKDLTYRQVRGKLFASVKPDMTNVQLSPAQIAHKERFSAAIAYGRTVMADPTVRPLYEQAAKIKQTPLFALTVADFMNPPSIKAVDASEYTGQVGEQITIKTADDFGVSLVNVTLFNAQSNEEIERGRALETGEGSGLWHYTAKTVVPAGTEVKVNVVAADRPGGTAVETQTKTL